MSATALIELVNACRNYAGEAAINEATSRVHSQLQHISTPAWRACSTACARRSGATGTRQSQVDAAVRFAAKTFGADGVLIQCSVEEALELELGMRGLTSYAETVLPYGTEQVFTDGDEISWSKAFLTSAYASRHEDAGVVRRGRRGPDGRRRSPRAVNASTRRLAAWRWPGPSAPRGCRTAGSTVPRSRPRCPARADGGRRHGDDAQPGILLGQRRANERIGHAPHLPDAAIVLAGSDFVFSGFGSIQRYDNMFGPSNFNAEDIDDFLAMQRDWGIDGGLRTVDASRLAAVRREAAEACRAVYAHLGLADFTDEHVERAVDAAGSKDLGETDTLAVLAAAQAIRQRGLTVVDIVAALDECGYAREAERTMAFARARLSGDYLQTSAIFDSSCACCPWSPTRTTTRVRAPATSPRRPGRPRSTPSARPAGSPTCGPSRRGRRPPARGAGPARPGQGARDVVIGVSPAVGRDVWRCLSGLAVTDVLREMLAGLEEEGCEGRVVRFNDSVDLGRIGLAAARLAGSGIGIGLQGKGTALIHRRDLAPLANLELYSVAPSVTPSPYRLLGANAARHAKGGTPDPARNPYSDEAIEARYHTTVIALMELERRRMIPGAPPEELSLEGLT